MPQIDPFALASDTVVRDTDRIAALKDILLEVEDDPALAPKAADLASKIVLNRSDDLLVRQHAAQEVALYPRPSLANELTSVLCDAGDDIDLRVNLLDAFQQWNHPLLAKLTNLLDQDDPLKPYL